MKKRVMLAAGGTGGHIFPAMALAKKLEHAGMEVVFAGKSHILADTFASFEIPSQSLSFKNPLKLFQGLFTITKGVRAAAKAIKTFSPDVVIGFGSFYSLPTLIAAKLSRRPIVLHEQNSRPGRVNRLLSPFATLTCVQFQAALKELKGKTALVKMLVRPEFESLSHDREEAFRYFNLSPDKRTLLVFGGSQGAKGLNEAFEQAQEKLSDFQILHLTGKGHLVTYTHCQSCVRPFETRMDLAWSIADLVIARSGAGTVSEHFAFSVPALFIPYPYAMDNHQEANADFAVGIGGARKLLQRNLTLKTLSKHIHEMMEPSTLAQMKQSLTGHKSSQKSPTVESLIEELLDA